MRTEEDPRWQDVLARRAGAGFVYSVKTTGVYCRPSCPSRRARPENVAFHDTAAAAERAGFRACKRCRPDQAPNPVVARACRMIEAAETAPDLAALAREAGLSRFHFQRVFKAAVGVTPKAYAMAVRGARVRAELRTEASVTAAIYEAGFGSSGRFYEHAADMLGMTPSAFRGGGAAETIMFAVGQCSLGAILVARSETGVCAISLGDDPEALVTAVQERFSRASLVGGDAAFEAWVAEVVGFVEAPGMGLDLPLDIRGTAFQQRVWRALREIPVGATVDYSEVARRIGMPRAVRAVASACAANGLAVAIPCHRVVRRDGGLSGYRWGVERKRALLGRERG